MRGRAMRFLLRQPEDVKRPSLFWRTTAVFVMLSQLLLCDSALAQVTTPSIVAVTVSPAGNACTANMPLKLFIPSGTLFSCQSGTYGQVGGSGTASVSNSDGTLIISPTSGAVVASLNLAHSNTWTANGALSAPAALYNGAPVATGGTGTTTWPLVLLQPNGTTTTTWSTVGTFFGINAASGYTGNLIDLQLNGGRQFQVSAFGSVNTNHYGTLVNCSSPASPAVCAGSTSGSVAVPITTGILTVNTTAMTANSQVQLTFDSSLSARLAVTCNTTAVQPTVSARTAGTSFTITVTPAPSSNPACFSYTIIN